MPLLAVDPQGRVIERNPTQAEVVAGLGYVPPTPDQVAEAGEFNPWLAETDTGTSEVITYTDGVITQISATVLGNPRIATINRTDGLVTSVVTTWGAQTHTETINYNPDGTVASVAVSIT